MTIARKHLFTRAPQLDDDTFFDQIRLWHTRNDSLFAVFDALVNGYTFDSKTYHLSKEQYRSELAQAWTMTEFPGSIKDVSYLWKYADPPVLMVDDLPENLTLYRGAPVTQKRGMSWTNDLDLARWFAKRFSFPGADPEDELEHGFVWSIQVPKTKIYAAFHGRDCRSREAFEVVVPRYPWKIVQVEGPLFSNYSR